MQKFQQENLEHIQDIFSQKTGVHFPERKKPQIGLRKAVVLAAADSLFFDGDRLCCGKIFFFKGR